MDGEWFCEIAGREIGPLLSQQLRAMAAQGQILPGDRIRRGTTGPWSPASHVKGLFPATSNAGLSAGVQPQLPAQPQTRPAPEPEWDSLLPPEAPSVPRRTGSPNKPPPVPQTAPLPQLPPLRAPSPLNNNLLDGVASLLDQGPSKQRSNGVSPLVGGYTDAILLTQAKRKRQQQQRLIVSLAIIAIGVTFALIVWVFGPDPASDSVNSSAKRAGAASESKKAVPSPPTKTPITPAPTVNRDEPKNPPPPQPPQLTKEKREAKEEEDPILPPTGTPEADFGIRPEEVRPESPVPNSVPKSS